jgi:lipoyl synthase
MHSHNSSVRKRLPLWLKRPIIHASHHNLVVSCLNNGSLHTVCNEAKCPNRAECYSRGTATFLIMGNVCTRSCRFCGISHGPPSLLDPQEGERIARAAIEMKLKYVVITSVTRDDLPDGGAGHFASVISQVRANMGGVTIEVLVPDFNGDLNALDVVLKSGPDVFNHNVETVPRLYPRIRPGADYPRSLKILAEASRRLTGAVTKSGMMVGLGETEEEVREVMKDVRKAGCSLMTIGQYLQPTDRQVIVESFISPDQFKAYEKAGIDLGFERVFAGPFVRSSYRASEMRGC